MIQKMFSIYDSKAQAYITPFFMPEQAMAVRVFADAVNNPEHEFGKHPEDYTLFYLGGFENLTTEYISNNTPVSLGTGLEVKTQIDLQLDDLPTAKDLFIQRDKETGERLQKKYPDAGIGEGKDGWDSPPASEIVAKHLKDAGIS